MLQLPTQFSLSALTFVLFKKVFSVSTKKKKIKFTIVFKLHFIVCEPNPQGFQYQLNAVVSLGKTLEHNLSPKLFPLSNLGFWCICLCRGHHQTPKLFTHLYSAYLTEGAESTCEVQCVEKLQTKRPFPFTAVTQWSRENGSHALPGLDCTPGVPGGILSVEGVREESSRWRIGKLEDEDESGEEWQPYFLGRTATGISGTWGREQEMGKAEPSPGRSDWNTVPHTQAGPGVPQEAEAELNVWTSPQRQLSSHLKGENPCLLPDLFLGYLQIPLQP